MDRHGAAQRGVVDPRVAGEVDAPDRMSRSHPDARGQVPLLPIRAVGVHFHGEIEAALRLGAPPQLEQACAQRGHRGGAGKAHFARMKCRLTGRRGRSDEGQAQRNCGALHIPYLDVRREGSACS